MLEIKFNFWRILVLVFCIFVWSALIFSVTMLFSGCKTFEPIWDERLPAECNMSLNTYKLFYETKDKSATVPSSDFCFKKLHRLFCQGEVFGYKEDGKTPKPVDYNNSSKYRDYEQCKAELK